MSAPTPLRLCHITETLSTGVGRHLVDLTRELTARGHEVHVLHSEARAEPDLVRALDACPRVYRRGFRMRRDPHPSDLGALLRLFAYCRRQGRFDIVHGHSSKGGAYARLLGPFLQSAVLYTPHAPVTLDMQRAPAMRGAYAMVERLFALLSNRIICCSAYERRHLATLGITDARLSVIEHGISEHPPTDRTEARRRLGLPAEGFIAGFVGRLSRQKGPDLFLAAAERIAAEHPKIRFVLIGDGPMGAVLRQRADLRLGRRVIWLGSRDARPLLAGFDVLLMPSRYEGSSYTLLEAMCAGVPVIASRVGAAEDLITNDRSGFLVAPEDVSTMAGLVRRLAGDAELCRSIGAEAAAVGRSRDAGRMAEETLRAYVSCVDEARASGWNERLRRRLTKA